MYSSRLLELEKILPTDKIVKIAQYFDSLPPNASSIITTNKLAEYVGLARNDSIKVLTTCAKAGLLNMKYGVRCPFCSLLIEAHMKPTDIPDEIDCYGCDEHFIVDQEHIEVFFALEGPHNSFLIEQSHEAYDTHVTAHNEPLKDILMVINEENGLHGLLYSPNEDEYKILEEMYTNVFCKQDNTKQKGNTLESLIKKIFNLSPLFRASEVRTDTNQIDCYVRNRWSIGEGFLAELGDRLIIECKNEQDVPPGHYFSKIHSIISTINGKARIIKFGAVVSLMPPPKTYKSLANKYFLSDELVIASIYDKDIQSLVFERVNLLELLERKRDEVVLCAVTDLRNTNLFNA